MQSTTTDVAVKIADFLLQIQAIKLSPDAPFTWASGWKSPIYCDNRIALSYPEVRSYVKTSLAGLIQEKFGKVDCIAGVATAAIAQGALVADMMNLPFVYVRSSAKEHGRGNQIEGEIKTGQKVVVIEDLISTGKSSLAAVEALRTAGADVVGMVAVFTYGFDVAKEAFATAKCPFFTLSDYNTLLTMGRENASISADQQSLLSKWREQPDTWGK